VARRDPLRTYRAKRDFDATPEPAGGVGDLPAETDGSGRFVIQEHHATSMHWDLRLEHDGVLLSWALPKGVPLDPKRNHLAVRTEDHPLEYLDFAGVIPAGEYGGGRMTVWDHGTYDLHELTDRKAMVTLHGERARGRYALFQTRGKNWMIHRMDPPEDPDRQTAPLDLRPMLATAGPLPRTPAGWSYEIKWDGIRALGHVEAGRLHLVGRNGTDLSDRYPELRPLGRELGSRDAVLDGEIVVFGRDGRPDFQALQSRMHVQSAATQRRLAETVPAVYVLFDLLWLDGRSIMDHPYVERRALLEGLRLEGPSWQTPPVSRDDPAPLVTFVQERELEGLVSKRLDSRYEPGRRSTAWIKTKFHLRQELVVGGWTEGQGRRDGALGALLLGYHEEAGGPLRYAGKVGTGFSDKELRRLQGVLAGLARDDNPFEGGPKPPRGAHFVEPELVAEIRFTEWTHDGTVRHPAYLGTRDDRDPAEVVREG
jgi:bifunctional non-homologous end joining protein LigD